MVPHGFEKAWAPPEMRSPDVYKALDPPEICLKRASRPYRHTMKPHHLWSQLSIPEAPRFHQRQPLSWLTSDFSARAPKGGLKSNHLEAGIPPGFCSFERPALAAA